MKFPKVKVKTEYTRFKGGIDLETPAMKIDPGRFISAMNYVAGTGGGMERIDGYERYDGQTSPSDATYYYCPCSFTGGGPSVGDTITGADSGETAEVIVVGDDYIDVTKLSGDFNDDEVYTVGGSPKGTFTAAQVEKGETTALLHATALNEAADVYRDDIAAPTGSGAIRGGVILNGVNYCFRDNAGGTAGLIYKETSSGWSALTLGYELSFDTGQPAGIADGDTITQLVSGATATVDRVVLESGSWAGSDAAGRLIISGITGTFNAVNALQVGGTTRATSTSTASQITLLPGGSYDCIVYNFTGSTATKRIYGCDGVNRGFELGSDDVYVPIDTGMTTDTPEHVAAYKRQLFFSFKASSQNSDVGYPYQWTAVLGAAEIALGDDITGYLAEAQALIIYSRNSTHQLLGNDATDFVLDVVDDETGAITGTMQSIIVGHCLDDSGIQNVSRTQDYGNFNIGVVGRKLQARIDSMRAVVTASSVYKHKNQYRLYGSDGTGICATISVGENGLEYQFTQFKYPDYVACAWTGEDSTGKDVVFFGSDQGMVYQADSGSSFDGDDIEAYLFPAYNHNKSPTTLKTYRRAVIDMTSEIYSSIRLHASFSFGNSSIQPHIFITEEVSGGGGFWDIDNWDEFFWDSDIVSRPSFVVEGDGTNISIMMYSKTDIDIGHNIEGVTLHYTPRRLVRG